MAKAYRIVDWKAKYELDSHSKPANENTNFEDLRVKPIPYLRVSNNGLLLSPEDRKLNKMAWSIGVLFECAVRWLYIKLCDISRDQTREYRGWVLDSKHRPLNPYQVAEILEIKDTTHIKDLFDLLCDPEIHLLELVECPVCSPYDSPEAGENRGMGGTMFPQIGGKKAESFMNVTEANNKLKNNRNVSPGPVENGDTPARPSDSETVRVSEISDSVSVLRPSVGRGYLISDIPKLRQMFLVNLMVIIKPRTSSDQTTYQNISRQLEKRMTTDTELNLFELALEKAAECHRATKPIAMFVAAMKEGPFFYVPQGNCVIRGKLDGYKK